MFRCCWTYSLKADRFVKNKALLLGILLLVILICLLLNSDDKDSSFEKYSKNYRNQKLICLWTVWNNKSDWNIPFIREPDYLKRLGCPETRCTFVLPSDRHLYPVTDYDAIVFNSFDIRKKAELPSKRTPKQIYAFVAMESPHPWWIAEVNLNIKYNYTITYREDSDSKWEYSYIQDKVSEAYVAPSKHVKWRKFESDFVNEKIYRQALRKTKNIVAVISNCGALSGRLDIISRLKKHIDVDFYGKCGNLNCTETKRNPFCLQNLDDHYRFYASFENSLCKEYTTEKLFYALERNIIPLVYGGSDYTHIAPPHSYINMNDYKNFSQLAEYLKHLSENPKEYVKFFWWRKHYRIVRFYDKFCSLCENLHRPVTMSRTKVYKNITGWWFDNMCRYIPVGPTM